MGKRSLKILMQNVIKRTRMIIKRHSSSLMLSLNGKIIMSNTRSKTIKILKKTMMKIKILRLTRTPKYS